MERTKAACPASKGIAVGGRFQQRQFNCGGVQDAAVGAARRRNESLLGGENAGRGEQLGSGNLIDTRTVRSTQHDRFGDAVVRAS